MKKLVCVGFIFLGIYSSGFCAQSKTYPTSAITVVRMATYMDELTTIAKSTWTLPVSTWTYFGSTQTYVHPMNVNVVIYTGTTVINQQWPLDKLINNVVEETKYHVLNEVMDQDMEQYVVWPSSSTTGLVGAPWTGWCNSVVNGNDVPIPCP